MEVYSIEFMVDNNQLGFLGNVVFYSYRATRQLTYFVSMIL